MPRGRRRYGLERLAGFPFRVLGGEFLHAVEGEHRLGIKRMLDPERAILIEGRDAILRGDVARAGPVGRRAHEIQYGLLGRPVIPGRQQLPGRPASELTRRRRGVSPITTEAPPKPKAERDG